MTLIAYGAAALAAWNFQFCLVDQISAGTIVERPFQISENIYVLYAIDETGRFSRAEPLMRVDPQNPMRTRTLLSLTPGRYFVAPEGIERGGPWAQQSFEVVKDFTVEVHCSAVGSPECVVTANPELAR